MHSKINYPSKVRALISDFGPFDRDVEQHLNLVERVQLVVVTFSWLPRGFFVPRWGWVMVGSFL